MSLRLYDTRTREVRPLAPLRDGHVGLYVCGPTPQALPHVGHLMSAVVIDVRRQSGQNTIAVIAGVKQALKEIEPLLPPGLKLIPSRDD